MFGVVCKGIQAHAAGYDPAAAWKTHSRRQSSWRSGSYRCVERFYDASVLHQLDRSGHVLDRGPLYAHLNRARTSQINLIAGRCRPIYRQIQKLVVTISRYYGSPIGDTLNPAAVGQRSAWNLSVSQQTAQSAIIVTGVAGIVGAGS